MNDISTKIQILFSRLYLSSVKLYTAEVHLNFKIEEITYTKIYATVHLNFKYESNK